MSTRDFLPGRLGHTCWCAHMQGRDCDCGAAYPPSLTPKPSLDSALDTMERELATLRSENEVLREALRRIGAIARAASFFSAADQPASPRPDRS